MTPKMKILENVFPHSATGHQATFHDQIWWKSAVAKLPKGPLDYHTKNSGSAGLVQAPILPKMGRSRPKFPERCHPLICPRIPNLVWIGCALPDLFWKDWFFGAKSKIQSQNLTIIFIFLETFSTQKTEHVCFLRCLAPTSGVNEWIYARRRHLLRYVTVNRCSLSLIIMQHVTEAYKRQAINNKAHDRLAGHHTDTITNRFQHLNTHHSRFTVELSNWTMKFLTV